MGGRRVILPVRTIDFVHAGPTQRDCGTFPNRSGAIYPTEASLGCDCISPASAAMRPFPRLFDSGRGEWVEYR